MLNNSKSEKIKKRTKNERNTGFDRLHSNRTGIKAANLFIPCTSCFLFVPVSFRNYLAIERYVRQFGSIFSRSVIVYCVLRFYCFFFSLFSCCSTTTVSSIYVYIHPPHGISFLLCSEGHLLIERYFLSPLFFQLLSMPSFNISAIVNLI